MTPADSLAARDFDPFCENGVLATVNALADFSHSNALGQLVTAGRYRSELLMTLGKVGPPRYANFIGRYKDDPDSSVRRAAAVYALGKIAGPSAGAILRKALEDSLESEKDLERRRQQGESGPVLREQYGLGAYDLRETLQQAMSTAQPPTGR